MARSYSTDPAVVPMPSGMYKGSSIREVPTDYLVWAVQEWKTGKRVREALLLELQNRFPGTWQGIARGLRP